MVKRTKSASACSSAHAVKKPQWSLTTELVKELPSSQHALEVAGVAANISEPVATTQEAASKVAPAFFEPTVVIVTGEDTSAIPSSPVMMLDQDGNFSPQS